MAVGLYSGVSGLALGTGLYKGVSDLWSGASGLIDGFGGAAFSPASLFTAGEPGAWYDPSDLTTLFQDSAGTTPVTTPAQSVGLMLDKSGRGNHASQSTSAQRPTYGVVPATGRRNLLTFTEQFDNAVWAKQQTTITSNTTIAPDGTTTADALFEAANINFHGIAVSSTVVVASSGQTYTASFYAKANGRTKGYISTVNGGGFAVFDLVAKTIVFGGNGTNETVTAQTITELSDGWFRLTITSTFSGAANVRSALGLSNDLGLSSYLGDITKGVFIWGAQLEVGSTATAYQRVVSSFDVTETGVQSLSYVSFDGTDDGMLTGTITPGIDKAQVFTGVRKLSDAATGTIAELSVISGANSGAFGLFGPSGAGLAGYTWRSRGTAEAVITTPLSYASPITNVVTGLGDIDGNSSIIRVDGLQQSSSSNNQGTGNYLDYPLYIGRRAGASVPFNGQIYSMIVRFGATLSAATILETETYVGDKTGINIPLSVSPTIYDRFNATVLDRAGQTIEVR